MNKFKAILACGVCIVSATGCTVNKTPEIGVDDACTSLKAITADYANNFENFRRARSDHPAFTLYAAKVELVKGHCEIWEWAGGDHAYVCTATTPIREVAAQRYSVSKDFVEACVGSGWQKEEREREQDGKQLGYATEFTSPSAPELIISVQSIAPPVAYRQLHNNVFYIGTKGKRSRLD